MNPGLQVTGDRGQGGVREDAPLPRPASVPSALPVIPDHLRSNFAVLIPAFDEEEVVPELFRELRATFQKHGLSGEIIVVDDGSKDRTFEALQRESAGMPRVKLLRHRRNRGKTEAMVTAAWAARPMTPLDP